jgi:diacylglycerol kinase (ATP)
MKNKELNNRIKLIYNPHAGKKRKLLPLQSSVTLEQIQELLDQYQIPTDLYPTKSANHATTLAREAKEEGYKMVIAAGGDGTVGEIIKGLVNTDIILAILPLGSFMNVARMLSIPRDIEMAMTLIKIGRTRKIDVGSITKIDGDKLIEPYFFLEEAGVGIEADVHYHLTGIFERKEYSSIFKIFSVLRQYYGNSAKVVLDDEEIITKATLITISNGPYGGAAFKMAPDAKLNDHKLTVNFFRMSKWELFKHFIKIKTKGQAKSPKIATYQAQKVKIYTNVERPIHADARVFGTTPVEFKILPNALNVITGFPKEENNSLNKRTPLDP